MEKLLKSIAEAIQAAAEKEQGLPPWQAAQEIADNCEVAARWVEMYEMGRPAGAILTDLAREQEKAWEIIKGETKSYRENARRNNPEFPDGMFSTKCAAIALPLIARYIERMEREKEPRLERLQLAQRLAKEVLKECPETEIFGDEQSVRLAHFPILEEAFQDYARLRKDAYSEEAFREKLRAKLAALEADTAEKLRLYNPEEARPFVSDIRRPNFHKERQNERMDYLMALFRNTLLARYLEALFPGDGQPAAGAGQAQGEGRTFEELFVSPAVPALVIRAMQEAEPRPLLNEEGEGILSGKATVAPLMALVDTLFARKLVKEGIAKTDAYRAICSRFGFEPSTRPDKARKDGEGIYRDYKEGFREYFLNNRPE